jgi:hypothetical protein
MYLNYFCISTPRIFNINSNYFFFFKMCKIKHRLHLQTILSWWIHPISIYFLPPPCEVLENTLSTKLVITSIANWTYGHRSMANKKLPTIYQYNFWSIKGKYMPFLHTWPRFMEMCRTKHLTMLNFCNNFSM